MIYHLFQALSEYDIPGQGLMNYLSFRAMMATVTAMLVALLAGKRIIRWLQRQQIGETVRELGLADQVQKKGTPTMGGIIIIISLLCGVLLWCDLTNIYVQLLLLSTLWCGALGFTDDYIKVFKHNKNGLSEHAKLIGQVALGFIVGLTVWMSDDIVVREKVASEVTYETELSADSQPVITTGSFKEEDVVKSTKTTIPFVKRHEFDYKWLSPFKGAMGWYAKWGIYVLMIVLVITACSNGTNLTDGLDGLAAGTSAIVGVVIGILAWLGGNLINSNYLNIMYIPGSGEVAIFMSAFVGALVGFLADAVGTLFSGYGFNPLFCVPPILYGLCAGLFRPLLARRTTLGAIALAFLPAVVLGSMLYQSWSLSFVYQAPGARAAGFVYQLSRRAVQFSVTYVLDVVIVWALYRSGVFRAARLWPPAGASGKGGPSA